MKKLILLGIFMFLGGCASQNALDQPEKKDLSVLNIGTHRDMVILELGAPASTKVVESQTIDLFSFVQGYSRANRGSRAFAHGLADVATLGLWSLAGSQVEESFNGTIMGFRITYEDEIVIRSEQLIEKDVD